MHRDSVESVSILVSVCGSPDLQEKGENRYKEGGRSVDGRAMGQPGSSDSTSRVIWFHSQGYLTP